MDRCLSDYNKILYNLPNELQENIWRKYYEKYILSEINNNRCRNYITFHPYLDSVRCNAYAQCGFYCINCSYIVSHCIKINH